jgi:hypothetical protein
VHKKCGLHNENGIESGIIIDYVGNTVSVLQVEHSGMLKRPHSLGIEPRNPGPISLLPSLNSKKLVHFTIADDEVLPDYMADDHTSTD